MFDPLARLASSRSLAIEPIATTITPRPAGGLDHEFIEVAQHHCARVEVIAQQVGLNSNGRLGSSPR